MKKLLLYLLTTIFIILLAGVAQAKNGPHTGPNFIANTDACAACHRIHTGTVSPLLANDATSVYDFCTYCHNGSGANTNVVSGIFEGSLSVSYINQSGNTHNSIGDGDAGKGLNGGGFESAFTYTGRKNRGSGYQNFGSTSSAGKQRHNVVGADLNTFIAWGGGTTGPGEEIKGFTCVSCHDPHGTENTDGSERYRILKGGVGLNGDSTKVNGKLTGKLSSNELTAFGKHDYTKDAYQTGIANFCIACHSQYSTSQGTVQGGSAGKYNAGDGKGSVIRHRHKITYLGGLGNLPGIRGQGSSVWDNMNNKTIKLPLEQASYHANTGPSDTIVCLTCHQSHGTASVMSSTAKTTPAESSTLLRLSNRGVCEACHYK